MQDALKTPRGRLRDILHYFFFTLYTWTAGWLDPLVISFPDFISRLSSSL
jgi:hypothetical protein